MLLNIEDLRGAAKRRLPRGLFEFVDRGVEDEIALAANRRVFSELSLRPRVLRNVKVRDTGAHVFGQPVTMPVAVAPTGAAGLLWHDGEIAIAKAAAKHGIPFTLSMASLTSIERVAQDAGGRLWFQLYLLPQQRMTEELVHRAARAGFEALIVTVDTVVPSKREYNKRNGFSLPFGIGARNIVDTMLHPRWLLGVLGRYMLAQGMPRLENYPEELRQGLLQRSAKSRSLPRSDCVTWEDLKVLRRVWKGPLMVKGVLHPEDAILAMEAGADGVIVSNHGGRALDVSPPPLGALGPIADAVGKRMTIAMDGGIRRGGDIAKALALGADFVFTGRAPLWGAAAAGHDGASAALRILFEEFDQTLAMLGCSSAAQLDRSFLYRSNEFFRSLDIAAAPR